MHYVMIDILYNLHKYYVNVINCWFCYCYLPTIKYNNFYIDFKFENRMRLVYLKIKKGLK